MLTRTFFTSLLITLCLSSYAQNRDEWFEFYLPWDDSTKTVTDLSGYLDAPAGKHGFVTVDKNGHFKFENSDEPIRFVGVNMCAYSMFPPYEEAKIIAARMAKFGINLVRIHYIDWTWVKHSIFAKWDNTMDLDTSNLDKMNFLIKCLRDKGIYYNFNLHVSRIFQEGDTIPAKIQNSHSKYVTLFNKRLIYLQKDYARKLLNSLNPYTGLSYADDPAMASVELTNENNLFNGWFGAYKDYIFADKDVSIGPYYSNELDSIFNEWLCEKYKTTDALQLAWTNTSFSGDEKLGNGSFESGMNSWTYTDGSFYNAISIVSIDSTDAYHGKNSAKVEVTSAGNESWQVHLNSQHLKLEKDKSYQVVFYTKSDVTKKVGLAISDYKINKRVASLSYIPTKNWQKVEYIFSCPFSPEQITVRFDFGLQTGTFWIDSVSVKEYNIHGLEAGENLIKKNVKRCKYSDFIYYSETRIADNAEFYYDLEGMFTKDMMEYLKDDLLVKCPITFTQTANKVIASIYSQTRSDYIDYHMYWDHPSFLAERWSRTNFTINNRSILKSPQNSTINISQLNRVKGKSLVLSEYNHPYPYIYQTEAPSLLYAYGSFFDLDAILWFEYYSHHQDYSRREMLPWFDMAMNPLILTQLPLSIPYRMNYISKANTIIEASYNPKDIFDKTKYKLKTTELLMMEGSYGTAFLEHGFAHSSFDEDSSYLSQEIVDPGLVVESDTKELLWDGEKGIFTVNNPYWQGATGFLAEEHIVLDDIEISDVETTDSLDFASIQIVAMDSTEIASSQRMLLLTSARLENEGFQWNEDKTSPVNLGKDRALCEPVKLKLKFRPARADGFKVYQLNETGERVKLLPATIDESGATIQINSKTLWYEIVNSSKDSIATEVNSIIQQSPKSANSYSIYPNPTDKTIVISGSNIKQININTITGKLIYTKNNLPGKEDISIDISSLDRGLFLLQIITEDGIVTNKKIIKE